MMNADIFKGRWDALKGAVKREWGDLTDDDLARIDGEKDKLIGRIREIYGHDRDAIERRLDALSESSAPGGAR